VTLSFMSGTFRTPSTFNMPNRLDSIDTKISNINNTENLASPHQTHVSF